MIYHACRNLEAAGFGTDENKSFNLATTGELKVSKTNNTYTITISGTTDNGKTITGYYKGSLRYFDHTGYDKNQLLHPVFIQKEPITCSTYRISGI